MLGILDGVLKDWQGLNEVEQSFYEMRTSLGWLEWHELLMCVRKGARKTVLRKDYWRFLKRSL